MGENAVQFINFCNCCKIPKQTLYYNLFYYIGSPILIDIGNWQSNADVAFPTIPSTHWIISDEVHSLQVKASYLIMDDTFNVFELAVKDCRIFDKETCGRFHQHFTGNFFVHMCFVQFFYNYIQICKFMAPKYWQKVTRKMLMKLTPGMFLRGLHR